MQEFVSCYFRMYEIIIALFFTGSRTSFVWCSQIRQLGCLFSKQGFSIVGALFEDYNYSMVQYEVQKDNTIISMSCYTWKVWRYNQSFRNNSKSARYFYWLSHDYVVLLSHMYLFEILMGEWDQMGY